MPYALRGNKVVKSDTGEVVKDHGDDHAKAVRHLRALRANVEESGPGVVGALLEGFDEARHPRGFHGRWIGTSSGKVLRVFHGSASLGDAKPGAGRDDLLRNVAGVVSSSGRGMRPAELTQLVNRAKGSPEPTPRVVPRAGANAPRGGIPTSTPGVHDLARRDQSLSARVPAPGTGVGPNSSHRSKVRGVEAGVKQLRDGERIEMGEGSGVGIRRKGSKYVTDVRGDYTLEHPTALAAAGHAVRAHEERLRGEHVSQFARRFRSQESAPEVLGALLEGA